MVVVSVPLRAVLYFFEKLCGREKIDTAPKHCGPP